MFELKSITKDGIEKALAKGHRYRVLNEPRCAESICRDILRADAGNQPAIYMLVLALTDQFGMGYQVAVEHAQELLPRIEDDYRRAYYAGVICERWGKALYNECLPGFVIFDWLKQAMDHYEKAESIRPADDDSAILRWNTCARMIKRNKQVRPRPEDREPDALHQDDVPV